MQETITLVYSPLPYISAISFLDEITTEGNCPIKIIGNDYEVYLAKNSKSKYPATDIINEVIAHHLLKCWDISTPPAALIKIQSSNLKKDYSKSHKPLYYKNPVFGSKWIHEAIDCNFFTVASNKADYKRFRNPNSIFEIALFDIWVENDDRKPTNNNLILQTFNGKQKIMAIDNAFIFSSLNYKDLNPKDVAFSDNDSIIKSELAISLKKYKITKKAWAENDRQKFYIYIENSEKIFSLIIKNIPESWGFTDEYQNKVFSFLFNKERNRQVFQQYLYLMRL